MTGRDSWISPAARRWNVPRSRTFSLLTRMAMKGDGVGESQAEYRELVDDEHEHRFAEHEHEHEYRSGARIGRARAQPLAAVVVLVIERPLR